MNKAIVDISVVVIYLIVMAAVGLWFSRHGRGSKEGYFVGGRSLAWPLVGMSLFATGISSMQFVGQAGLAYQIGIAAANPQVIGAFMLGFSAIFFVPMFIRSNVFTVPDILEKRYSRSVRTVYSLTILTLGVFTSPFMFYAGGLAVLEILQLDAEYLWLSCLIMGTLVGLYTVNGGYTAVVVTDFMQGVLLLIGGLAVIVIGVMALPSLSVLNELPRERHLDMVLPASDPLMPWTAVITGLMVASLFFATVNHAMLQKMLGAKSVYHARIGMLLSAMLKVVAVFVIVLPGVVAAYLFPDITADAAFPVMVNRMLPIGISGLVLAAVIAALMSSADSGVNALSGIVSLNLYPLVRPNAKEKESVLVGKIAAAFLIAWSVVAAPFVGNFGLIFPMILMISAYMISPIGVCYLVGRFSKTVNRTGALTVMGIGYVVGIYLVICSNFPNLHFLVPDIILQTNFYHVSPFLFFSYIAIIFVVSWFTQAPDPEKISAFMLTSDIADPEYRPWYQSYQFWLGVLIMMILSTYFIF